MKGMDAYIAIRAGENTSELSDVPSDKLNMYYRLTNPFENQMYAAWEFVAQDQSEVLIQGLQLHAQPNSPSQHIPVKGLDPEKMYEVNGQMVKSGRALMQGGLNLPRQEGDCMPFEFYMKAI